MTNVKPGDVVYFAVTGLSTPDGTGDSWSGRVRYQGESLTITQALLDATTDRLGSTFLDLVDDEQAQLERWGVVFLKRGPAPEDLKFAGDDAAVRYRQYQEQMQYAEGISRPDERHSEIKRIRRDYADVAPGGSQTLATYGN